MGAKGKDELSKEQIDALVAAIERVERKRKIMLAGYLLALVLLVGGQVAAFLVAGSVTPGTFIAWVFLVPFAVVGAVMWGFGRWANRSKLRPGP